MTALHLARPDDAERVLAMIAAHRREAGSDADEAALREALEPLLEGSPHGAVYVLGPARAPVGYVVISFGWSLGLGGLTGHVEDIWIRPNVRGRGIGSEVLHALPRALAGAGLKALHVDVAHDNPRARALYTRLHFRTREGQRLMTRTL